MKSKKEILQELNVFYQCRKYNLPLWQCPSFLFVIMGGINIASAVIAYLLGRRYIEDPRIVALLVLALVSVLLIVAFFITQGMKELAKISRLQSEFIRIATHQLRSPLSALKWTIELLMSGRLGKIEKKQTEYFRILKENIYRMNTLISDLLTVSRIEAAKLPTKKEKMSLKEITEEIISDYQRFAEASNVRVILDAEENIPAVSFDRFQTKLLIKNLLDNAIRYTQKRGEVKVRIFRTNSRIHFSIKDSGIGIPKEDQEYIFKKFFRSRNVLEHQPEGSGLGLYISKSIVEKASGKIGFKSQQGRGSTFWFTLPIK